jgi:histidinol-phosphatase (PHP family)
MIVDYHVHLRGPTGDGEGPIEHTVEALERFVETAVARHVDEIGFTEHIYYFLETRALWTLPYHTERCHHHLRRYVDTVLEGKRRGLPVKLGLEVDHLPGREPELQKLLAPYPWDFLLGSVHWLDGDAVDLGPGVWDRLPVETVWARYFGELCALASSGLVDVLAHPDLAKIFGRRPAPEVAASLYEALAVEVENAKIAVEVSTAGLRKPVGEIYPAPELLEACRAHGVPITLASDAHAHPLVGQDFAAALDLAQRAGYDTVTVYDRREARQEPLG